MKRAYWRSHVMLAPVARRHGLTPSRFDMLLSIAQSPGRIILNKDLVEIVGATAGVVSRMVRALEELGLVACERRENRRRSFFVAITAKGVERVEGMLAELDDGGVQLAVESVVAEEWMVPETRERDTRELLTRLRRVRKARGDHGRVAYEASIAEELEDPKAPHRFRPWGEVMRRVYDRRGRRNWMQRRWRWARSREEARRLVLPGLQRVPEPDPWPFLPTIEYRGPDSMFFRLLFPEAIQWETGPFDGSDPIFQWIEVADREATERP
jgi:DNA-binding MarR family transcriptional regulator